MNLALIIPCYNEELRFSEETYASFLEKDQDLIIFFINDGSTDKTLGKLDTLAHRFPHKVKVLSLNQNSGKSEAVRRGMEQALELSDANYLGFWDADLATPLSELAHFQKTIKEMPNKWVIFGSRASRKNGEIKRLWYRHLLGRTFATVASASLLLPIYDTQCGAKFFKRDVAELIFKEKFSSNYLFDIELFLRLKKLFGRKAVLNNIYELPLSKWQDIEGSKIRPKDFFKAPFELFKILYFYNRNERDIKNDNS